jgi:putative transcription antitermination factor YqgF
MTYIGIDLWDKRVGIAIGTQWVCIPKDIIPRVDIISYLKKLVSEYGDVTHIVLGIPHDLYGKDTRQLEKTQKFKEKLIWVFTNIEIDEYDERFTTIEAKRDNDARHIDDVSASLILQGYLQQNNIIF